MTEQGTTMRALTGMIALELAGAAASTAQASESWVVAGGGNSCDALIR